MTLHNLLGISLDAVAPDKVHQTPIQSLPLTVGLAPETVRLLDALRKQRNLADYSGDLISDSEASGCIDCARNLLAHVRAWLKQSKPELI
jgi:hypothetical protein